MIMLVSLSVGAHMARKQQVEPSRAPSSSFIKDHTAYLILDNCSSSWHITAFQQHPFSTNPSSGIQIQGPYAGLARDSLRSLQPASTRTVNATLGNLSNPYSRQSLTVISSTSARLWHSKKWPWDTTSSIQLRQLAGEVWRSHLLL